MPGDAVIRAENLGKKYSIRHRAERERYATFRDALAGGFHGALRSAGRLTRGERPVRGASSEEFWALTNLDFEVRRGEVLGIIGRNGAGKSTLLKILSRITEPSAGRVIMAGRVASLLEVGTGFHPELTGRENVYLNGAVLGMKRSEVRRRFDEIVDFAGVGQFLDTPVKRYSSGMYVRLAFAVAAHLEQDILIVDEVLAVGDAEFQRKCIGKMDEITRKDGRTVLVVTHNMGLVTSLCSTAIWIDEGTVCARGAARSIVSKYLATRMPAQMQNVSLAHLPRSQSMEDDRLRFDSIEWLCDLPLQHGKPFGARIKFKTRRSVSDIAIGIGFSNHEGTRLLTYETDLQSGYRPSITEPGTYAVDVEVETLPLAPDTYQLDIGSRSGDFHALDYIAGSVQLEIVAGPNTSGFLVQKNAGVRLPGKWRWDTVS